MDRAASRIRPRIGRSAAALAALAAVTAYRIWILHRIPDQGYFAKYLAFADRIVAGAGDLPRLADLSPGYLWTVVLLRLASLDYPAIRAVQVVLVSMGIGAIGAVVWRRCGAAAGIAAAAILLLSRGALVNAAEVEPESLAFFAVSLVIAIAAWHDRPPVAWAAATGLAAGLATITRPTLLLLALVAAVWMATGPGRLRQVSAFAIAAALPIGGAMAANAAFTGNWILMNPGTVFHEGWNANASGLTGIPPRVVTDVERCIGEPDALHVAYRTVAGRAAGTAAASPRATNRFWTRLALRWVRSYPGAAAALGGRKLAAAIQSYDAWDLVTLERKSRLLRRHPAIPFGFAFAAALAGLLLARTRFAWLLGGAAAVTLLAMVAFYVSARQRNAAVPAVAALGGIAVAEIVRLARERRLREVAVAVVVILAGGAALTLPSTAAREHAWLWTTRLAPPPADELSPERLFDLARALLARGRAAEAERILEELERTGYRPMRENRGPSSISFFRTRAALLRGDEETARRLARAALGEAPGDPLILALAAATGADATAEVRLDALHDPFTARLARAAAAADTGSASRAALLVDSALRELPEAMCNARAWRLRAVTGSP